MYKIKLVDDEVIINIKNGDVSAFENLYHLFYPKVYIFIEKHLQAPQDAEELTQDIFLKIWKNRASINLSQSIDGYIFKIAKNTLIDFYRKKKATNLSIEKIQINSYQDIDPASQLHQKELAHLLTQAIENLPQKRKNIFLLSREEGLTYNQIANKLGISVKTVETQISLSLKSIKQKLKYHTDVILFLVVFIKYFF